MTNATSSKRRPDHGTKADRRRAERQRAQRRNLLIVLAVIAAVVLAGAVLLSGGGEDTDGFAGPSAPGEVSIERAAGPQLATGEAVPGFQAPSLTGSEVDWNDYEGSPTVLVVWASWCPHCQAELPVLVPAVQQRSGLELVSVTTSIGVNPGPTPPGFLAEEGLTMTTAVDDAQGTLAAGLGVTSFPTVYYVDASGRVIAATVGETSQQDIEAHLDALEAA